MARGGDGKPPRPRDGPTAGRPELTSPHITPPTPRDPIMPDPTLGVPGVSWYFPGLPGVSWGFLGPPGACTGLLGHRVDSLGLPGAFCGGGPGASGSFLGHLGVPETFPGGSLVGTGRTGVPWAWGGRRGCARVRHAQCSVAWPYRELHRRSQICRPHASDTPSAAFRGPVGSSTEGPRSAVRMRPHTQF